MPPNTKDIRHAYKLKYNLIITDSEKSHYLALKNLSALFTGITSKHYEEFYCLNCFQSYNTENKLKKHKKVCENQDYCYVEMSEEDNKILKYSQGEKSMKFPFIIYANLNSLLEKITTCYNNPENASVMLFNIYTLFI